MNDEVHPVAAAGRPPDLLREHPGGERISLSEVLDRVLNTGVVVVGEVVLSVADIDLVYLGLHLTLCSVQTADRCGAAWGLRAPAGAPQEGA